MASKKLVLFIVLIAGASHFANAQWKILYDSAKGRWITATRGNVAGRMGIELNYDYDSPKPQETVRTPGIDYRLSEGGDEIIYGLNRFKVNGVQDSIPEVDYVKYISLAGNAEFAITSSKDTNYLFRKSNVWQPHSIKVVQPLWSLVTQYFLWAAMLLIPCVIVLMLERNRRLNRRIKEIIEKTTVENALLTKSEKPLGPKDEDLLGFGALEDAVISIMRNPQTDLPMTIVISGNWGSGKSSMMNRIRGKLEADEATKDRFMTTWFNAWHFQAGDKLMDAFLRNIISSYDRHYASLFSAFRMRLWLQRFLKMPPVQKFMTGFALAVILPFFLMIVLRIFFNTWSTGFGLLDEYWLCINQLFTHGSSDLFGKSSLQTIGAAAVAIFSAFFLNKQLPVGLNSIISFLPKSSAKLEVEKRTIDAKEQFKKEYWEIVNAGEGTRRLVVFIDDIDRIAGDKVLELLESINFISDIASRTPGTGTRPPNTIFVLGMYTKEVTKNLGAQLNRLNQTEKDPQELGALYIEKMVQLIVPIPFDKPNLQKLVG